MTYNVFGGTLSLTQSINLYKIHNSGQIQDFGGVSGFFSRKHEFPDAEGENLSLIAGSVATEPYLTFVALLSWQRLNLIELAYDSCSVGWTSIVFFF